MTELTELFVYFLSGFALGLGWWRERRRVRKVLETVL